MHEIAVTIRHATVMDEEETRLLESIDETISLLRNDGVSDKDCEKVRELLTKASKTTDSAEYLKCFEEIVDILMPYVEDLKAYWEDICYRFNSDRPFDAEAVRDLVEIFSDLELAFGA